jgi:ArsR family transcriptional regulator
MVKDAYYYESQAKIAKAIAHPSRLLIIDTLAAGPMCVCEINKLLDIDQSTLSKHLAVLKNVGIVADEKKGMQVFYSLRCNCVLKFFSCAAGVLNKK